MPTFGASGPQVVYNTFMHLYLLANIVTMSSYGEELGIVTRSSYSEELGLPSKKGNYQFTHS